MRSDADPRAARVVKTVVLEGRERAAFWALTALGLGAIAWLLVAWFAQGSGDALVAWFVLTLTALVVVVNNQGRWFLLLAMRRPVAVAPASGLRTAVVTTYVPSAEPAEMLEASLSALVAIDYPHDTWLLDEGGEPAIAALCERLGVRHFTRHGRAEYLTPEGTFCRGTKHGNYNAWLYDVGFAQYDYLIAFDPDHVPHPSYADEVLGFFRDPSVGYVQPAQGFYNQAESLIARGAAEETYAYFSSVQMASFALGYPIIVGSHNAHRMAALKEVGGLAAHDADDLLLTIRYRTAGWEGVYVPKIIARGLAPVDWRGYLGQQRRWARSVLDLKLRRWDTLAANLQGSSRMMSFLHGINFLHRAIVFAAALAVLVYLLATGQHLPGFSAAMLPPAAALAFAFTLQEGFRQRFYLGEEERGLHWRVPLLDAAKWPWFILALADVATARRVPYVVTPKAARAKPFTAFIATNLALAATIVFAYVAGRDATEPWSLPVLLGAAVVITSLVLIGTALRPAPPPYRAGAWSPAARTRVGRGADAHLSARTE